MGLKVWICIILMAHIGFADITLKRYSISTFTNTSAIESDPVNLLLNANSVNQAKIKALRVGFRQYSSPFINSSSTLSLDNRLSLIDWQESDIYGDPLIYPNPMQLRESAILGYWLNTPDNITIQIYDIFVEIRLQ